MKRWLLLVLALLFVAVPAMAGEDPYIAVYGPDEAANLFYLSPKYEQFLYSASAVGLPEGLPEAFSANRPFNQPEICDTFGFVEDPLSYLTSFTDRGNPNAKFTAGNAGTITWTVRLPKKPSGEINLCIQCGVIKPNTFADLFYRAVSLCAAETGERLGYGFCTRKWVDAGFNPVKPNALPTITAIASPGPFNSFTPFNLTAFRNPGTYNTIDSLTLSNNASLQVLNGNGGTRVLLKSCMDKCVVAKMPVFGQINALGQTEQDLVQGDLITVTMTVPRQNTVDIYCHNQSLKVMGIGEAP